MSTDNDEDTTPDRPSAFHRAAEMTGANAAQRIRVLEEQMREVRYAIRVEFLVWFLTVTFIAYSMVWGHR